MEQCICSSCSHLKGRIAESGEIDEYTCEYGYPSEACAECEGGACSVTCSHFSEDADESVQTVQCSKCGKELNKVVADDAGGEVFCVSCYLADANR